MNGKVKVIIISILLFSCKKNLKQEIIKDKNLQERVEINNENSDSLYYEQNLINFATIDSVSIKEIKYYIDDELPSIYEYYQYEKIESEAIWSNKLFGRCCSEADLLYSELLEFDITTNVNFLKYPNLNLTDKKYNTAFTFKDSTNLEISIKLKRNNETHKYHTGFLIDDVLKTKDTILKPFRLSVVNGYVKSEQTFKENGRIKQFKVLLNDNFQGIVELLDTPMVQEFNLDFIFTKNDVVTLIPINYYKGTKYNDVCISEIQSSLSQITHFNINKKYNVRELRDSFSINRNK